MSALRLPIVACMDVVIDPSELTRIGLLADALKRQRPNFYSTAAFGPSVRAALNDGPAVLIGDQSEIPLHGTPEEGQLQYRVGWLANAGDVLVISGASNAAFEHYMGNLLGVSGLQVTLAKPDDAVSSPIPKRCLDQPGILGQLVQLARQSGRLTLLPHLTTGHVWNLARVIAEKSGVPVSVAGPPPRLSALANDKLWFADRVTGLLGPSALPATYAAYGPASLARRVQRLAKISPRVVVKVPNSSGSAGNLTLQAETIRDLPIAKLRDRLVGLLESIGWSGRFPLLVEVWECPVVSDPSVQIWIPEQADGLPVVEGIYEQVVQGVEGEFVGAIAAQMPDEWKCKLAEEATRIATLFQELGYFGRCSFDAVIAGEDFDHGELHWIECNGRWGGVSIPMTLANRLLPTGEALETVVVQRVRFPVRERSFSALLEEFSDLLFIPGKRDEGIVFLTPHVIEQGTGIHFMALAPTLERAKKLAAQAQARLRDG